MQQQQNSLHRFIVPGKGRGFNGYLSRAQFSHRPGVQKTDCFICLEEIAKNEHLSFDMPCCGHVIHLTCWGKGEAEKRDISTPSCPMCRSIWRSEVICRACLRPKNSQLKWWTPGRRLMHHCEVRNGN